VFTPAELALTTKTKAELAETVLMPIDIPSLAVGAPPESAETVDTPVETTVVRERATPAPPTVPTPTTLPSASTITVPGASPRTVPTPAEFQTLAKRGEAVAVGEPIPELAPIESQRAAPTTEEAATPVEDTTEFQYATPNTEEVATLSELATV
jgi:hypothetical protein